LHKHFPNHYYAREPNRGCISGNEYQYHCWWRHRQGGNFTPLSGTMAISEKSVVDAEQLAIEKLIMAGC